MNSPSYLILSEVTYTMGFALIVIAMSVFGILNIDIATAFILIVIHALTCSED